MPKAGDIRPSFGEHALRVKLNIIKIIDVMHVIDYASYFIKTSSRVFIKDSGWSSIFYSDQ